jgi:hypothetical protein
MVRVSASRIAGIHRQNSPRLVFCPTRMPYRFPGQHWMRWEKSMPDTSTLPGSWRKLSWTRKAVATGKVTDAMGPDPIGYIAYHADGRMMALVLDRDRPQLDRPPTDAEKIALYDSMLAYSASYTVEGNTVIHHVDGSWNPAWGKQPLIRPFELDGDSLVIAGAPGRDPVTGEEVVYRMEFRKV